MMDMDKNGKVSKEVEMIFITIDSFSNFFFQEFRSFCKALSTKQVEIAFQKFDISGDEELDYQEFCRLMNSRDKQSAQKREEERMKKRRQSEAEKLKNKKTAPKN